MQQLQNHNQTSAGTVPDYLPARYLIYSAPGVTCQHCHKVDTAYSRDRDIASYLLYFAIRAANSIIVAYQPSSRRHQNTQARSRVCCYVYCLHLARRSRS